MKFIDRTSGKRIDAEGKLINAQLKKTDPIKRNAEKDLEDSENSPMDPPDAYDLSSTVTGVNYEDMSPMLKTFVDEHKELVLVVDEFEKALMNFHERKYFITKEINDSFNKFFVYFDEHITPHNRKEERHLFPVLHKKLIETGEHGIGDNPTTAVDLMEDDHIKFIQLASLVFNLLGLAMRLPDQQSRAMTFDLAYHNGKELVELLKLHVFREDHTLFPLAQKLLLPEELIGILQEMDIEHA